MIDKSWKVIGNEDPYYGVLTSEEYKGKNLSDETLNAFYHSGYSHVELVIKRLSTYMHLPDNYSFDKVLDFGCGTGRLVIPFAEKYKHVTGVDISEGMLKEATGKVAQKGLKNISFLQMDDIVSYEFSGKFDLVHTYIVLQHINEQYGYKVVDKLASVIMPGGYGIIHLLFAGSIHKKDKVILKLKRKYKWFNQITNLLKGRPLNRPFMQMNAYDLNIVFTILLKNNITDVSTEFTDHDGFLGVILYFRKKI